MRRALGRDGLNVRTEQASHAGWALHLTLPTHEKPASKEQLHPYHEHARSVARISVPPSYRAAFTRWQDAMTALHAVTMELRTTEPLVIGLGNTSVTETGVTLHHTYGVPLIPGSALKGLTRRAAQARNLKSGDEAFDALFGTAVNTPEETGADQGSPARPSSAGAVSFWDAWIAPGTARPLQQDIITVHHQAYYQGQAAPTDFDDPNPVPFLSVPAGTTFFVALTCDEVTPGQAPTAHQTAWTRLAAELLLDGLVNLGVGGKTNAGYGRFARAAIQSPATPEDLAARAAAAAEANRQQLERQFAGINGRNLAQEGARMLAEVEKLQGEAQREALGALRERIVKFEKKHPLLNRIRALLDTN